MVSKNFLIYSSSAGSGKTYTLTKSYIKLLINQEDPFYFKTVLAITFTNDACNEMKSRILKEMANLSTSEFGKIIASETELEHEIIQKRAKSIYKEMLHNYSDIAIMTIDSFTNMLVSAYKYDLNLPFNYEISLDHKLVIEEAVDNIIERIGTDSDQGIGEMVAAFAQIKIDDDKPWASIQTEIVNFYSDLMSSKQKDLVFLNELSSTEVFDIQTNIKAFLKSTLESVSKVASEIVAILDKNNVPNDAFFQGNNGAGTFFRRINKTPSDLFEIENSKYNRPNSYVMKGLEENNWVSKNSKSPYVNIILSLSETLQKYTAAIVDLQNNYGEKYVLLTEINKKILLIPLIKIIKNEVIRLNAEKNEVFLSEFTDRILQIVREEPIPFIYERTGEKFNHILIDEFQDTSKDQIANLLPLIENALSKNLQTLIVGDAKQAIYSWRGGDIDIFPTMINGDKNEIMDILDIQKAQEQQLVTLLNEKSLLNLNSNYRSATNIVKFNNDFFHHLSSQVAELNAAQKIFNTVKQESPSSVHMGGNVAFEISNTENMLEKMGFQISFLLENGYLISDIAILVRKNKEGVLVANYLKNKGYQVNSSEALLLNSRAEIKFLIAFINFSTEPNNEFYKFEIISFYKELFKVELESYATWVQKDSYEFLKNFSNYGHKCEHIHIFNENYYELIEYLIDSFDLVKINGAQDFIFTFLDFALNNIDKKGFNVYQFLDQYEIKKQRLSAQLKINDAITVSTIHKSKGLEYTVVLMPFFKFQYTSKIKNDLWINTDILDYPEIISGGLKLTSVPLKQATLKFHAQFKDQVEIAEMVYKLESLNLLYVAFTRAIEQLWVGIELDKDPKSPNFLNEILNYVNTFYGKNLGINNPEKITIFDDEIKPLRVFETSNKKNEALSYPCIDFNNEGIKLSINNLLDRTKTSLAFGNVIHECFEYIKTEKDVMEALAKLQSTRDLQSFDIDNLRKSILEIVNHPDLKACFNDGAEVFNELEIYDNNGDIHRPDRIVFNKNTIHVIDYKTGEKQENHKYQILHYGQLLRTMGYQNIVLLIVYFHTLEVINVEF